MNFSFSAVVSGRIHTSPAQNGLKDELTAINNRISSLNEARNLGIGEENVHSLTKQIKDMMEEKNIVNNDQKASYFKLISSFLLFN